MARDKKLKKPKKSRDRLLRVLAVALEGNRDLKEEQDRLLSIFETCQSQIAGLLDEKQKIERRSATILRELRLISAERDSFAVWIARRAIADEEDS